jgi:hypothetical protein
MGVQHNRQSCSMLSHYARYIGGDGMTWLTLLGVLASLLCIAYLCWYANTRTTTLNKGYITCELAAPYIMEFNYYVNTYNGQQFGPFVNEEECWVFMIDNNIECIHN